MGWGWWPGHIPTTRVVLQVWFRPPNYPINFGFWTQIFWRPKSKFRFRLALRFLSIFCYDASHGQQKPPSNCGYMSRPSPPTHSPAPAPPNTLIDWYAWTPLIPRPPLNQSHVQCSYEYVLFTMHIIRILLIWYGGLVLVELLPADTLLSLAIMRSLLDNCSILDLIHVKLRYLQ